MKHNFNWINEYNLKNNNEYENYTKMGKYLAVYKPEHHKATKEGMVYIHQLQAEKKLGRPLKDGECVHHIDEDKFNNDVDNLIVFKTNSDHAGYHKGCNIYLEGDVWVADKYIHIPGRKNSFSICPRCNKNLRTHGSKVCYECYLEIRKANRKAERPTKENLLNLIINIPMTKIGKMYGVSDNAIRRWCKDYELPYTRNLIKKYKKDMELT